ncbi:MAG: pseudouridine synthase [Saprospiraceae bacterium]|nr:pseudouridine synthase [Saprospiraceae bacterium]
MASEIYIVHKPYGYLSQFTQEQEGDLTLAELVKVGKDVYPVGRLDKDSEGLLVLTNDKTLNAALLNPEKHILKTYWVQVEGDISKDAISQLSTGVTIAINKSNYFTKKAEVKNASHYVQISDRNPPIRYRKNIVTSWIEITIIEGKNRQVRKMCAKVGFPALRVIRIAIGKYRVENFDWGKLFKITKEQIL